MSIIGKLKERKQEVEEYRWKGKGTVPFYETIKKSHDIGIKKKKRRKKKTDDDKDKKKKTKAVGPWGPSMFGFHE